MTQENATETDDKGAGVDISHSHLSRSHTISIDFTFDYVPMAKPCDGSRVIWPWLASARRARRPDPGT